jgi:PhoPQ-activated pathogenicity-related protein
MIEPLVRLYQRRQFPIIKVLKKLKNTLKGAWSSCKERSMRKVLSVLSFFLFIQTFVTFSWAEETALDRYVAKSDDSYLFTHYHTEQDLGFITYFITMTSQQWRTSPNEVDRAQWEHDLMITVPWSLRLDTNTAILFIDGGSNDGVRPTSPDQTLSLIALLTRLPVVRVRQIPNQPLYFADQFGQPRTGDAILAYSLDKFLDGVMKNGRCICPW